jgi:hypothetical protein
MRAQGGILKGLTDIMLLLMRVVYCSYAALLFWSSRVIA